MKAAKKDFETDSQVSDDAEQEVAQSKKQQARVQNLYEENLKKYVEMVNASVKQIRIASKTTYDQSIKSGLIEINQINYETNVGILDIIDTKGSDYKKIAIVFTFLENQIDKIIEILQGELYDSLLIYGQGQSSPELMAGSMMGVYKRIYDLVRRLMSFVENLIMQLHSIINKANPSFKSTWKTIDFSLPFNVLGKSFRAIYVVDCLVEQNDFILKHWAEYRKMIKLTKAEPEKFGTTLQRLKKTEKYLGKLQNTILSTKCMLAIAQLQYDEQFETQHNPLGRIKHNKELRDAYEAYFGKRIKEINSNLSNQESDQGLALLELMCSYTLFRKMYPGEEFRSLWKSLWEMQKKIPVIEAHSYACVYIAEFLVNVCPLSKKSRSLDPKDAQQFLLGYISKLQFSASNEIATYYNKFCVWLSRMESTSTSNNGLYGMDPNSELKNIQSHFVAFRGVHYRLLSFNIVLHLSKIIYLCFILHTYENKPISKQFLGKLVLGLQTIKAIYYTIRSKTEALDTVILGKTMAKQCHSMMKHLYQIQEKKSKCGQQKLELLQIILSVLQGPISTLKLVLVRQLLGFISNDMMKDEDVASIKSMLNKLEILLYHQTLIPRYINCSYLYICKKLLPDVLEHKREQPHTCKRLSLFFDCLNDSARLLSKCKHLSNNQALLDQYKTTVFQQFEQYYMAPLKEKIEDFLRISVHSMLIQKLSGFKPNEDEMNDLMKLVQCQQICIFDSIVNIRKELNRAFNSIFYDLSILNTYDMETYQQMRIMGNHIFGLSLHSVFLPTQTIEQGKFNILKIIRNIPEFIKTYHYNLLSQKFLEITSEDKIIESIGIQQLSDSIRTHGLGILATTVNAFYKFLVLKMQAFSKFLYTECIRTPLERERKWFRDYSSKKDYTGYYPYERAQHLYQEIKKLGQFQNESNYLDHLREIITAVGNSLGFVRLLRSASLNSYSHSIQYLPKKSPDGAESLQQIAKQTGFGEALNASCFQLDQMLKGLEQNFGEKLDYMNLLLKAFQKITSKENKHLKLFCLVTPALTINYIEHICRGKQQVNKKIATGAFLYDDGFILGLSYFIALLKQEEQYKALHWQEAIHAFYNQEQHYAQDIADPSLHSAKFLEDMNMQRQLMASKLESMYSEFKMFNYNMTSASVLFKGAKPSPNAPKSPATQAS